MTLVASRVNISFPLCPLRGEEKIFLFIYLFKIIFYNLLAVLACLQRNVTTNTYILKVDLFQIDKCGQFFSFVDKHELQFDMVSLLLKSKQLF